MTLKEDSSLNPSMITKPKPNLLNLRADPLDLTKFLMLLPTTEEPSDTPTLISMLTIPLNSISPPTPSETEFPSKSETSLILLPETILEESEPSPSLTDILDLSILSMLRILEEKLSPPESEMFSLSE